MTDNELRSTVAETIATIVSSAMNYLINDSVNRWFDVPVGRFGF
jgi:hypothetical protein